MKKRVDDNNDAGKEGNVDPPRCPCQGLGWGDGRPVLPPGGCVQTVWRWLGWGWGWVGSATVAAEWDFLDTGWDLKHMNGHIDSFWWSNKTHIVNLYHLKGHCAETPTWLFYLWHTWTWLWVMILESMWKAYSYSTTVPFTFISVNIHLLLLTT